MATRTGITYRPAPRRGIGAMTDNIVQFGNYPDWIGEPVTITTPGTPVRGPNIVVPDGVSILIQARSSNAGNAFFQRTSALVLDSNRRFVLIPGEGRTYYVQNGDLFWFDAATANDVIEVSVEQGQPRGRGVIENFGV